jgi:hypothetical protein
LVAPEKPLSIVLRSALRGVPVVRRGADDGHGVYIGDFGTCGSVIGGLTSGFTTWLSQRSQARAGMVAHDLARREDLIRDFIIAASKTYGDAIINSEPKMPELVDLYAMVSRMRVLGMTKATACADIVMRSIVETYYTPNRTVADLRELTRSGQGIDPLRDFSEAARQELHTFAML